jgi:hypothetical protein
MQGLAKKREKERTVMVTASEVVRNKYGIDIAARRMIRG